MSDDIKLIPIPCEVCGVVFGLPEHLLHGLRRTHRAFCCPNGHDLSFKEAALSDIRDRKAFFEKPSLSIIDRLMVSQRTPGTVESCSTCSNENTNNCWALCPQDDCPIREAKAAGGEG